MTRRVCSVFPALLALVVSACGGGPPTASSGAIATPGPTAGTTAGATRRPTSVPIPTGSPLGDRLMATISVPMAPCAMAVDAQSVWITGNATGELIRVDPATNAVAGKVTLEAKAGPCGIAIGPDGRIWVALLGTGAVVAVDPVTMEVTARIDDVGPQLWDLKAGFGSIWVADRSAHALLQIDPDKERTVATIPIGTQPSGLAVLPAGVWVSDDADYKLRRIDPKTNEVAATIVAAGAPSWFADDGAANLVVAERASGHVVTVDPGTDTLGAPLDGWLGPLDGTIVGGVAWIPEGAGRRVGVVNVAAPASEVVRYALPGAVNPFVAEPGFGSVWVLDFGGTAIWRLRP